MHIGKLWKSHTADAAPEPSPEHEGSSLSQKRLAGLPRCFARQPASIMDVLTCTGRIMKACITILVRTYIQAILHACTIHLMPITNA